MRDTLLWRSGRSERQTQSVFLVCSYQDLESSSVQFLGAWFHFLGQATNVTKDERGVPIIRDNSPLQSPLSQSHYGWNRAGFFLTWTSASNESASPSINLICFGALPSLVRRFETMKLPAEWQRSPLDPYSLFLVVLNDLFLQMDETLWSLASVFRQVELVGRPNVQRFKNFLVSRIAIANDLNFESPFCIIRSCLQILLVSTMWLNTSAS